MDRVTPAPAVPEPETRAAPAARPGPREPVLERLASVPWEALIDAAPAVCAALRPALEGAPAERALDKLLRANRGFCAAERAAAAEALFGVALWRRRLAFAAGLPSWEGADPALLLCALLHALAGLPEPRARALAGLSNPAVSIDWRLSTPGALADRYSLPDWLADILLREAGAEAEPLAAALCTPGPVCLRANPLLASREKLIDSLREDGIVTRPGRLAPHALLVETPRPNLLGARAHRTGWFEVQDEGSQLLGHLVEARPGETVLDACAGAGGKSLLLAAELGNRGRVVAVDPDAERLARLGARARRAGATCIEAAGAEVPGQLTCDRALVDAPCSELGALRRGPDARWRLRPADFTALPALQLRILARAAQSVRTGGRLVYATCTLRREENEEVAREFEATHSHYRRVEPGPGWLDASFLSDGFFRALPHLHGTDGFFAAVWQRSL